MERIEGLDLERLYRFTCECHLPLLKVFTAS